MTTLIEALSDVWSGFDLLVPGIQRGAVTRLQGLAMLLAMNDYKSIVDKWYDKLKPTGLYGVSGLRLEEALALIECLAFVSGWLAARGEDPEGMHVEKDALDKALNAEWRRVREFQRCAVVFETPEIEKLEMAHG